MSMRVLLVTPDYPPPPGGIQTLIRNLERGLEYTGHNTRILHLSPDKHTQFDRIPRVLPPSLNDLQYWPYIDRLTRETNREIRDWQPDVVHTLHVVTWPALRAAQDSKVPGVVSTHALELSADNLVESAFRYANSIHAVSEFTGGLCHEQNPNSPVNVIYPSISIPNTIPKPTPDGPIFCISRLVRRKNVENLVKAWKNLPNDFRERHGLVIAGDGEQRERIEAVAASESTISVLGRVSESRKSQLLSEASAFVLTPTRQNYDVEGFGIVYLEAQASGTPVIGSNTGGVPEAVGNAGLLVDSPEDPAEITQAIQRLLTNNQLYASCYSAIAEQLPQFSLINIAQQHIKSYNRLNRH